MPARKDEGDVASSIVQFNATPGVEIVSAAPGI